MRSPSGFCLTILLTFFSTLCQQAPAFSRQYELGTLYSFGYEASVLLNDGRANTFPLPKDVGFKLDLDVSLSPIWQSPSNTQEQVLELKVSTPKLFVKSRQNLSPQGFVSKSSKAEKLVSRPFFLHREGGVIKRVFYTSSEELSMLNIKKGIASLFQYQPKDGVELETDASGICNVAYRLKGKQLLYKEKTNCKSSSGDPFFSHYDWVLGANISSHSKTTFELDLDSTSIKSSSSNEIHILRPNVRSSSAVEVIGKQVLYLKETKSSKSLTFNGKTSSEAVEAIARSIGETFIPDSLLTSLESKECIACKSLQDLVNGFHKSLSGSNLGTQSCAIVFLRLLGKMRESDEKTIKMVLKDKKNSKILPQLLDVVAAAQTIPSYSAAKSVLDFKDKIELTERYLLSLSVSTHPSEFFIEDLLKISQKGVAKPELSETLTLAIASLTKTFSQQSMNPNQKIVSNVLKRFMTEIYKCKDEHCTLKFIRAMKNLQNNGTVPTLIRYAKGSQRQTAIYAMRAIQTMPLQFLDPTAMREIETIFLQLDTKHDSSVRAMAAEILFRWRPKEDLLKEVFQMFKCQDEDDRELHTLIFGHLRDLCEKNPEMEKLVRKVLRENNLSNYHILSQGGLSSAFSRPLVQDSSLNASFTNMLEISGGILKRSNVDVFVNVGDAQMRLLSFGMFAGGLSMFSGDDGGSDEEAHAGIEIALMGTQLRPFVFFQGQGELMGHVWSGTASERTTALQGSVLLQDHHQIVRLQNGLNVLFALTGVISYDMAGQIQISLWNRNAHSLVEVGAASVLRGQARVENSFVQTMVEFNVGAQTQLNFISDLEFSESIMMCLQMVQPKFNVIDNVRKLERIPGTNYALRKYKRKSSIIPGKTFVMNKKNTELCNIMFSK